MKYRIVKNQKEAAHLTNMTSYKDSLVGWTYNQLVKTFGEPVFGEPSGDGKVNFEWVFQRTSDKEVFTLYDWKSVNREFAQFENKRWNVGGKVYAGEFVTDLIEQLKKKH
jgi:hypothetical protein